MPDAATLNAASERRALIALNVLGGLSVLGSYVLAFALSPEIRSGLWGGVPEGLRPLYTVNMFAAAAGYFPFTFALVLSPGPGPVLTRAGIRSWVVAACYAAVLMPSALWLPLTALHQMDPGPFLWVAIRAVLFAVAIGASGLVWLCLRLAREQGGASWLAFGGTLPFWLQTAILDALVWPAYYGG
ncbi:MAG: hypothetical protein QNK05_13905 [Myxococcota bacterium]|nr:hypothetical protein [Myxococcota bacterium]